MGSHDSRERIRLSRAINLTTEYLRLVISMHLYDARVSPASFFTRLFLLPVWISISIHYSPKAKL
jgi:hypothetical protein